MEDTALLSLPLANSSELECRINVSKTPLCWRAQQEPSSLNINQMCHNKFWGERCVCSGSERAQEGLSLTIQAQEQLRKVGVGSANISQQD